MPEFEVQQRTGSSREDAALPSATRASAARGAPPSNTAPQKYQSAPIASFLWQAIDSLYLSYPGELNPTWQERLDQLKALAQSQDEGERAKAQAKIGEHVFEVHDRGQGRYAWVLEDNAFRVQVSKGTALPLAYAQIRSEFLAHVGARAAVDALTAVVRTLGRSDAEPNVSRLDLCADFSSPLTMDSWPHTAWVTRAQSIDPHYKLREFTGWSIGLGGSMSARLYDKVKEILTKRKGAHLFEPWTEAGWTLGEPVWRLEAQFRRDVLKEMGVNTFTDADANLDGLWRYFTEDWLRLAVPDGDDDNRSRWPLHPLWSVLSSLKWGRQGKRLRRFRLERVPDDEHLLPGVAGYITSYMAREGIDQWHAGVREVGAAVQRYMQSAKHGRNLREGRQRSCRAETSPLQHGS